LKDKPSNKIILILINYCIKDSLSFCAIEESLFNAGFWSKYMLAPKS